MAHASEINNSIDDANDSLSTTAIPPQTEESKSSEKPKRVKKRGKYIPPHLRGKGVATYCPDDGLSQLFTKMTIGTNPKSPHIPSPQETESKQNDDTPSQSPPHSLKWYDDEQEFESKLGTPFLDK